MKLKWQFVPVLAVLLALTLLAFNINRSRQINSAQAAPDVNSQVPFQHDNSNSDKQRVKPATPAVELTVPAGTALEIRMQTSLSSATASPGDTFKAALEQPLMINGQPVAPQGAIVTGCVVSVRPSGRLHHPAYLRITLTSLNLGAEEIPLRTSSIFFQGFSHKKRDWLIIGGGTGAGATIGGISGGGKEALMGSAIGAGVGTGAALATGKKDIVIGTERRLTFRLTQELVTRG